MAHILVVEGDPSVRELLVEILAVAGHDVAAAAAAQAARDAIEATPVELAVVECVLVGEPGEALARHLGSLGVPVILMSGDIARLEQARPAGLPVLAKPFRLSELVDLVAAALRRDGCRTA